MYCNTTAERQVITSFIMKFLLKTRKSILNTAANGQGGQIRAVAQATDVVLFE